MAKKSTKRKNITLRIDEDLANQWDRVVEIYGLSKSDMFNNFLAEALPILLETDPSKMLAKGARKVGETLKEVGDIIEKADTKK